MIQGGDPTGTGRGGTSIYGPRLYVPVDPTVYTPIDTIAFQRRRDSPRPEVHGRRDLGHGQFRPKLKRCVFQEIHSHTIHPDLMCTATGSQFFISLAPTPYLDNLHTIFGRVQSGMRVVQRLGSVAVDAQDRLVYLLLVRIRRAWLTRCVGPRRISKSIKLVS